MPFREAALKLRGLLYDCLSHVCINQSTAHGHKFKIEMYNDNYILVVWDYANRNITEGPQKATYAYERDPKLGCSVALALSNPVVRADVESEATGTPWSVLCDFWRSHKTPARGTNWNLNWNRERCRMFCPVTTVFLFLLLSSIN